MGNNTNRTRTKGFTLVELLTTSLILGILSAIGIPAFISSVFSSRQEIANTNARALATAVESHALSTGTYDTVLGDYAWELGGNIPINPCTQTSSGYTIVKTGNTCSVTATAGTFCGTWSPTTFTLGE